MTADELRELAFLVQSDMLSPDGRKRVAAYLRACADAMEAGPQPVRVADELPPDRIEAIAHRAATFYRHDEARGHKYMFKRSELLYFAARLLAEAQSSSNPCQLQSFGISEGLRLIGHTYKTINGEYFCWLKDGPHSPPIEPMRPVYVAENTSAERVVETAEREHEPVAWMESPYGAIKSNPLYRFSAPQSLDWRIPLYAHPPTLRLQEPTSLSELYDTWRKSREVRLPEPMTNVEWKRFHDALYPLPTGPFVYVRAIEAETLRRVKEANNG